MRVLSCFKKNIPDSTDHTLVSRDNEPAGTEKLLEKLQGSLLIEENVFPAAAEAVSTAMCKLLIKKQCSRRRENLEREVEWIRKSNRDRETQQITSHSSQLKLPV